MWIYVTNFLGIVFTLGLLLSVGKGPPDCVTSWKTSQVERDRADSAHSRPTQGGATDALGEEAGDFFDVDFGL